MDIQLLQNKFNFLPTIFAFVTFLTNEIIIDSIFDIINSAIQIASFRTSSNLNEFQEILSILFNCTNIIMPPPFVDYNLKAG